jgi:hypothetical protein
LLITQKDFQYEAEEYFSFMPDDDPSIYGHSIPAHYRVQVHAAIVSGKTCVGLSVHIQDFEGRQEFDVCAGGSWSYSRCDLHCKTNTYIAHGQLPYVQGQQSYVLAIDVTPLTQTLIVDNQMIATIHDKTYTLTDQLAFAVYGDQDPSLPVIGRFSNFLYTPYP